MVSNMTLLISHGCKYELHQLLSSAYSLASIHPSAPNQARIYLGQDSRTKVLMALGETFMNLFAFPSATVFMYDSSRPVLAQ